MIKEDYIKEEFVKAVNEVIKNKKGIIEEAKVILETLNNTDKLKEELYAKEKMMQDISIKVDELLKTNSSRTQDQAKFKEKYDALEAEHTKLKNEAEALEKEIEYKIARKIKLECVIKAYKHSKIITEFSEDLWNGLLDKCLVFEDHIEFRWK
jgi:site-specific DNA recombinase